MATYFQDAEDSARVFVSDRFQEAEDYTTKAWSLLNDLLGTIGTHALEDLEVKDVPDVAVDLPSYTLDPGAVGDIPALDQQDIDTSNIARPVLDLAEISSPSLGSVPAFGGGTLPSNDFTFVLSAYSDTLLETLKTQLAADVAGGAGFSAAVEQALYDRNTRRQQITQAELYTRAELYSESRGHNLSNGVLMGQIAEANIEIARQQSDISNDVLIKAAELEQRNAETTKTAIVQLESVLVENFNKFEDRRLDAEKTRIGSAIDVYNLAVTQYNTMAEVFKIESNAAISQMQADLTRNQIMADVYKTEMSARAIDIESLIAEAKANTDIYAANVAGYSARAQYFSTIEDLKIKNLEVRGSLSIKEIELYIKKAEAEIRAAIDKRRIENEAVKSQAAIAAQVVASALNSVNAAASYGFSGSTSENHGFDETKQVASGESTSNVHTWDETK